MRALRTISDNLPALIVSLPVTFFVLFVSVAIALLLGLLLALQKMSRNPAARIISSVYISFMRGTPMVVQILIVFISVPLLLNNFGISTDGWNNMIYAIFAFSLNEAAFFAEIFRSAYTAIDKGQIEAAQSVGMSKSQVFLHVILPQGSAFALPNTTNMIIELMKNTSLGLAIGVVDLMGQAKQISLNNYGVGQTEVFVAAAVMYWIITAILLTVSHSITKWLNRCENATVQLKEKRVAA
ncbi:MAG: amino acid ABC transporter permease [Ethanoligenens sp.]